LIIFISEKSLASKNCSEFCSYLKKNIKLKSKKKKIVLAKPGHAHLGRPIRADPMLQARADERRMLMVPIPRSMRRFGLAPLTPVQPVLL
jgi:hypothetical protein